MATRYVCGNRVILAHTKAAAQRAKRLGYAYYTVREFNQLKRMKRDMGVTFPAVIEERYS